MSGSSEAAKKLSPKRTALNVCITTLSRWKRNWVSRASPGRCEIMMMMMMMLPDKRNTSVTGRLRHARTFEPLTTRTVKFRNSFIPYSHLILIKFAMCRKTYIVMRLLVLVLLLLLPGHIHVLLYFMYRVLYYCTTCYNAATGCYMIINNYYYYYSNLYSSSIGHYISSVGLRWNVPLSELLVVCRPCSMICRQLRQTISP